MPLPTLCHSFKFSRATMRGATANSAKSASNKPPAINKRAACATTEAFAGCSSSAFDRVNNSKTMAHAMDTHVCAVNSLAAVAPAMAGLGSVANSSGTTMKPTVVKLPHHKAARNMGSRCLITDLSF